jgi:hypothetical protein
VSTPTRANHLAPAPSAQINAAVRSAGAAGTPHSLATSRQDRGNGSASTAPGWAEALSTLSGGMLLRFQARATAPSIEPALSGPAVTLGRATLGLPEAK